MRLSALAIMAVLLLTSCTNAADDAAPEPAPEPRESAADVRATIEGLVARLAAGMESGDMTATVAELYTANARFHPPQAQMVEGHEAIAAAFNGIIEAGLQVQPSPVYIDVFDDVAFEYGTAEITTPDGQTMTDTYVVLWKKVDGTWKMHRDFVNGTLP